MSTELRQALEQVARRFRQRPALERAGALLARLGPASAWASSSSGAGRPASRSRARWLLASLAPGAAVGGRLRVPGARARCATRAGSPGGSRRNIPSWAPGCWPPSSRTYAASSGRLGFLQTAVIREALEHRQAHDWDETVPTWTLRGTQAGPRGGPRLPDRRVAPCWSARRVRRPVGRSPSCARGRRVRRPGRAGQHRDRARHPAPGRRPLQRRACRPTRASSSTDQAHSRGAAADDAQPGRPDVRRPRRVGRRRPRLSRRVRRPEHRDVSRPRVRVSRARSAPTPSWSSRSYTVARAEDRRGHPPRHGRRGDRADLALPAQQGRRRGPAGRREGQGDRARAATEDGRTSTARPSRSPTRSATRSSWSTAKAGPTSSPPRSW